MTLADRAALLLAWQPDAIDIRAGGDCHCGARDSMVFYDLPDSDRTSYYIWSKRHRDTNPRAEDGRWINPDTIKGGWYCAACGFGNAGGMLRSEYDIADVLEAAS